MKEALLKVKGNSKLEVNIDVRVKNIKFEKELDFIEIDIEDDECLFSNLTLIKGEIFPLPKPNDLLNIKKLYFDYDKYLFLRLFIKAEIKPLDNSIISDVKKEQLSFSNIDIKGSLMNIFGIKENIEYGVFKFDSIQNKNYILLCLKDLNKYKISIEKSSFQLTKNELFLVSNYFIKKNHINDINEMNNINDINEIIFNDISFVKKLSEEKIFQSFYKESIFGNKLTLLKIININEKYYIVLNHKKDIYQIERTKKLEDLGINICQLLLIHNFKLIYNLNSDLKEIILYNNSYQSKKYIFQN